MKDRDEPTVITILYDHESTDEKFITDWGVSIHVKRGEKDILFDVGKDKNILLHNMEVLDIKKENIDEIVISHRHWDHFGGLTAFEDREDIKIYVPNSLVKRIKEEFDFDRLTPYEKEVDLFLFDTKGRERGGTGIRFNWEVLKKYPSSVPFFLSGGIGPGEAIEIKKLYRHFQENNRKNVFYGIDVNSKFETAPGLKDAVKLKIFREELFS